MSIAPATTATAALHGTTLTIGIPSDAQAGQLAHLWVVNRHGSTTPAGWQELVRTPTTNGGGRMYLFERVLSAADAGTSVTMQTGANSQWSVVFASWPVGTLRRAVAAVTSFDVDVTEVPAPSVTPTAAGQELVSAFGTVVHAYGTVVDVQLPDGQVLVDAAGTSVTSSNLRNTFVRVGQETLATTAASGTRTATAAGGVQTGGISLLLSSGAVVDPKPPTVKGSSTTATVGAVSTVTFTATPATGTTITGRSTVQVSGPTVTVFGGDTATPSFQTTEAGVVVLGQTVTASNGLTAYAEAHVTVQEPDGGSPVAFTDGTTWHLDVLEVWYTDGTAWTLVLDAEGTSPNAGAYPGPDLFPPFYPAPGLPDEPDPEPTTGYPATYQATY